MSIISSITGSASGLDRNPANAVLDSGDRLGATGRSPRRRFGWPRKDGDRVRTVTLGVTNSTVQTDTAFDGAVVAAYPALRGLGQPPVDTPTATGPGGAS